MKSTHNKRKLKYISVIFLASIIVIFLVLLISKLVNNYDTKTQSKAEFPYEEEDFPSPTPLANSLSGNITLKMSDESLINSENKYIKIQACSWNTQNVSIECDNPFSFQLIPAISGNYTYSFNDLPSSYIAVVIKQFFSDRDGNDLNEVAKISIDKNMPELEKNHVYCFSGGEIHNCPLFIDNPAQPIGKTPNNFTVSVQESENLSVSGGCQLIAGDYNNRAKKLNLVIIPSRYENNRDGYNYFREEVQRIIIDNASDKLDNYISKNGDIKTYITKNGLRLFEKINFWIYTDTSTTFDSDFSPLHWVSTLARASWIKSNCNGDYFLILHNVDNSSLSGQSEGQCQNPGIGAFTFNMYKNIPLHELGHCIAGLNDEEPVNSFQWEQANCSSLPSEDQNKESPCPKWKNKPYADDVGCFKGCFKDNWYRPVPESIMKTISNSYFNAPSLEAWDNALQKYQ